MLKAQMQSYAMKIAVPLAALSVLFSGSTFAATNDGSWYWFTDCGGPMIRLELRLDHKVVFKSEFPMCNSNHRIEEAYKKSIDFAFASKKPLNWRGYGYNDSAITPAGRLIKAHMWLAGTGPHAAILGLTLSDSSNRAVMNTIDIVYPEKRTKWNVGPGLFIVTSPIVASTARLRATAARLAVAHAKGG